MRQPEKCNGYFCRGKDKADGKEPHTCPYAEEINDDHESLCNCCEACEHECYMDI